MRNSCWLGSTPLKEEQTCPAQQCGCHLTGWGGSPQGWANAAVPGSFLHAAASMLELFGASLSCLGNRKHGGQSQPQTPGDLQGATGRPRAPPTTGCSTLLWVGAASGTREPWGQERLLQDMWCGQWDRGMCTSALATGWSPEPLLVPRCSRCVCGPAAELGVSMDVNQGQTGSFLGLHELCRVTGCRGQVQLHRALLRCPRHPGRARHRARLPSPSAAGRNPQL